jgi:hypothetical protein
MHAGARPPGLLAGKVAGWRASRIDDPVARLRFLRHSVGDLAVWDPRTTAGSRFYRRRGAIIAVAALAALWAPSGAVLDAGRATWHRNPVIRVQADSPETQPAVWQVDENKDFETYSNGLRIERRYEVANEPRAYQVLVRDAEDNGSATLRSEPAGIVYHTTESLQVPFEVQHAKQLEELSEGIVRYVRNNRSYNYVVDRVGRVWRVVKESDVAWHAGHSVWADSHYTYLSLNSSFLGVAVEAQTQAEGGPPTANPAQIHAVRVLTEMLRARYHISSSNCVTHAQVSVNPSNMQIGYHTDWAARFPYLEVGLRDNYAIPPPAMTQFGFSYDPSLINGTGEPLWRGLSLAEEHLREQATAHGIPLGQYRQELERRYKKAVSILKTTTEPSKEKQG